MVDSGCTGSEAARDWAGWAVAALWAGRAARLWAGREVAPPEGLGLAAELVLGLGWPDLGLGTARWNCFRSCPGGGEEDGSVEMMSSTEGRLDALQCCAAAPPAGWVQSEESG